MFSQADSQQTHLRKHKQSKYEGVNHSCNQCKYKTTHQASLRQHTQLVHGGGNKYGCNQCLYAAAMHYNPSQHK